VKTIYMHIGAPKTGTTSIQRYAFDNREALAVRGIWYPRLEVERKSLRGTPQTPANHNLLASLLHGPQSSKAEGLPADLFERVLSEFAASPHPSMLLSAEMLFQGAPKFSREFIPPALADFRLVIICYVRRSDHFVESFYKTAIKGKSRRNSSVAQFIRSHSPRYAERMASIVAVFEPDRVVIRSYDECKAHLLEDFLSALLDEVDEELCGLIPEHRRNVAFNSRQTLFLKLLNERGVATEDFLSVRKLFRKHVAGWVEGDEEASLLSHEACLNLVDEYNADIDILNARFGTSLAKLPRPDAVKHREEALDDEEVATVTDALRHHLRAGTWARLEKVLRPAVANSRTPAIRRRSVERTGI
jgi:hypothetical protein